MKVVECLDVDGRTVKDAADYFVAGRTIEVLTALMDAAPEFLPGAVPTTTSPAQWFRSRFPGLLPVGLGRFMGKTLLYGADLSDDCLNHRARPPSPAAIP